MVKGSKSFSNEAKAFTELALEVLEEDEDLEVNAILQFLNGMDKECQALEVFRSIYKVDSDFTNDISDYFLKSNENFINLQDLGTGQAEDEEPPMPSIVGARVLEQLSVEGYVILQFNSNHLDNATTLGFINTFYHELIHAKILHLYHNGNLLNEYPSYIDLDSAMDNFFADTENTTLGAIYQKEMHDIFIDFIDPIANSLVEYCNQNDISSVDFNYAKKLVWGGLNGYHVFYDNLTTTEQIEAQILLGYENSNITINAKGSKTCD